MDVENAADATPVVSAQFDDTHLPPTFAELGVRTEIVAALADIGIERTFAIQELTLPLALAGEDLIGQARTGTGKTFGFGVPLLHRVAAVVDSARTDRVPSALVIVPTRELCLQVHADLENAAKRLDLTVTAIYGGRPYEQQIAALRKGVDVVVGTPGRLLDLANQGHLVLGKVRVLVLDEADEMLDLGFLPDIERILTMVPDARQTMLFSATMPGPIITLARTFLTQPTHIRAEEPNESAVHERTAQFIYRAHALDKSELVARILQARERGATMVFTRTKRTAQKVAEELADRGFAVGAVHGDLNQVAREKALKKFRTGKIDVLVATDVAARGIDIDDVTHVINYQCPEDEKTYVHRIGRTGRAGRTGVAVTLVDWDEIARWEAINAALGLDTPDPVETYSRSAHLYTDLDIPTDITGTVKRAAPEPDSEAEPAGEVRERPQRRNRNRRRTRGGQPVDAAAGSTAADDADSAPDARSGAAASATPDGDADQPKRRRWRRRKPAGTGDAGSAAAESGDSVDSAPREAADSAADTDADQGPKRPRRRRRRTAENSENDTATSENTEAAAGPAAAREPVAAAPAFTDAAVPPLFSDVTA